MKEGEKMQTLLIWLLGLSELLPLALLLISKRPSLKWEIMGEGKSSTVKVRKDLEMTDEETKNSLITTKIVSEGDLNYPPVEGPWSNLPSELLEKIFARLGGILDTLSIRGTCEEWRRVALADHHHRQTNEPSSGTNSRAAEQYWFLLYGKDEYPNCALYDPASKKLYDKFNIPELGKGDVDCIASKDGWLLLFQNSNRALFFFCPFSRAKIDLPKLPNVDEGPISRRIAAFSSPPTSEDCIVCVCTQTNYKSSMVVAGYTKSVFNVLRRGANNNEWDNKKHEYTPSHLNIARCATFWNGGIYFFNDNKRGVGLSLEDEDDQWINLPLVRECVSRVRRKHYGYGVKIGLGVRAIDSLSVCGTQVRTGYDNDDSMTYMYDDEIVGVGTTATKILFGAKSSHSAFHDAESEFMKVLRCLHLVPPSNECDVKTQIYKGVWLQPCFLELPPNYNW